MSATTQVRLAESSTGRIILHLACYRIDHHFLKHLKGIIREFTK
jgi:hypothetical protein